MALTQNELKRAVAEAATAYVKEGEILGVGTGSTVDFFIDAIAPMRDKIPACVSSSERSTKKLEGLGFKVLDMNEVDRIGVYVDGADEIDGGAVNADRTGIDYDKQYSVVLKGNGSGKDAAEISFADTINNASALTADKINLTLTGASGSFGNFGSKGTDLSLNDSHLKLNYAAGEYQQLTIGNLSVTGNSYLSFGANFLYFDGHVAYSTRTQIPAFTETAMGKGITSTMPGMQ